MTDPFNILGEEFDVPPTFQEAVREAVSKVDASRARFAELALQVPEELFTEEEWRVVERAASDVEEAVERADEGYVAVQFDSHAWYRIIENLQTVHLRLESAVGMMERVLQRMDG
jgi:hypothetical protein